MPSRCSRGVTLLPGGRWSPPQLGARWCRSPPVFVFGLGHMTVNLRRQLPTPSARCLGTPIAPEPPQLWPLRHPLSGHTQHLPSSPQLQVPLGPHSTPQLWSFWLKNPQPDGTTCGCCGAPPMLPEGGGYEVYFLTLSSQKAFGGPPSPHPSWALPCPRPDPARKVAAKDARSPEDTGSPWDTLDLPHRRKTPREQEGAGCPVGYGWNSFAWGQSCWKLACCGFGKLGYGSDPLSGATGLSRSWSWSLTGTCLEFQTGDEARAVCTLGGSWIMGL